MALGGLTSEAFRIVFGNPDVMTLIITFTIVITLTLIINKIFDFV